MLRLDPNKSEGTPATEKILQSIQENLSQELLRAEADIQEVKTRLGNGARRIKDFQGLETDYPYYIFENGKLIHWSDFRTTVDESLLKRTFHWRLVNQKSGIYLVEKRSFLRGMHSFDILYYLPLFQNYQIESSYLRPKVNSRIFGDFDAKVYPNTEEGKLKVGLHEDSPMFSLDLSLGGMKNPSFLIWSMSCLVLAFAFMGVFVYKVVVLFDKQNRLLLGGLVLLGFLVGVRWLMLYFEFPFRYVEIGLFDPRYFAVSNILPSLGDLLLNTLFLGVFVLYIYLISLKSITYLKLIKLNKIPAFVVCSGLILISYLSYLLVYDTLHSVYFHSQLNFDITKGVDFNIYEIVYLLVFLLISTIFFGFNHIIFRFLFIINGIIDRLTFLCFIFSTLIFWIISSWILYESVFLLLANGCYILIVYYFQLYKKLSKFKYLSYLYLVSTSFVCAVAGAMAIQEYDEGNEFILKNRFAEQLIIHNDPQGEYLISEVGRQIRKDRFIKHYFRKPSLTTLTGGPGETPIEQKIKRVYLGNYFDKYDVKIYLFSYEGAPYRDYELQGTYEEIQREFSLDQYRTDNPNLFFINYFEQEILSKYLDFIEIKEEGTVMGYIILDFTLEKHVGRSILPRLLQDAGVYSQMTPQKYDYAVFSGSELNYSIGEFNYERSTFGELLQDSVRFNKDIVIDGYHHLIAKGFDNKTVIVSSIDEKWSILVANFSFLFLITVFFSLFAVAFLAYSSYQKLRMGFSTKIQFYLNLAYFLPLLILSITLLSITTSNYENDLEESFRSKAQQMGNNITNYIITHRESDLAKDEEFLGSINRLAKYAESDVNLYDADGRLLLSTQPLIFEVHLLSDYLNPEAKQGVFDQKHKMVLIEERIGDFRYKSVYIGLTTLDEQEFLGVLSIPFFNSKYELASNKIKVIVTVMNTFTAIFIIILILSYFAFKTLTGPLKLIAQKIKRTTFGGENEQLQWSSNDEIGALVNEYNEMLVKLEESKRALAKSEKETAWREMAQQVAHEIKNPLTPMKLKLQHLLRVFGRDGTPDPTQTKKAVDALITQVDTLSDIATSFSSFAKMPTPENSPFDITGALQTVVGLYRDNDTLQLIVELDERVHMVNGDEKLLGRIFSNLIINGTQAVPSDRKAKMTLKSYLTENGNKIILEFEDNGSGIDEDIAKKVFIPNFTTKKTGSGIGLAVAKRGVEHAGGKIWFETEQEIGTTFFIELPLVK